VGEKLLQKQQLSLDYNNMYTGHCWIWITILL